MKFLQENPIEGMLYSSYNLAHDEQSFVHINICKNEKTLSSLNDVEAFQLFRKELKASQPIDPPKQTKFDFIGSSFFL